MLPVLPVASCLLTVASSTLVPRLNPTYCALLLGLTSKPALHKALVYTTTCLLAFLFVLVL